MNASINNDRWLSVQEICECLGVKRHKVIRWIEQRGMPAAKVGKLWCLKVANDDEWVKSGGASNMQEVQE